MNYKSSPLVKLHILTKVHLNSTEMTIVLAIMNKIPFLSALPFIEEKLNDYIDI